MTDTPKLSAIERTEQRSFLLLFLPALILVALIIFAPLGKLVVQSFQDEGAFSLVHYKRIVTERIYWSIFVDTLEVSLAVTALSALLGYPVAYAASRASRLWTGLILAMVMLPFWTSVLVRTYGWLVILQRRGIVNSTLMDLGIISKPLELSHNYTAVLIGMVHVMVPFIVFPLYAALSKIPPELAQAGNSLGGTRSYVFRRVILPLSAPGLLAGAVLVFVLSLGFYLTPELLGGGKTIMVSSLVERNIEQYSRFGAASSVALSLLVIVLAIFWVVDRVLPVEKIIGVK